MGGDTAAYNNNYIECKDREITRLFPLSSNSENRTKATIAFREWSKSAANTDGHITLADGSDTSYAG